MSRSNPSDATQKNPTRKFLKWDSGNSQWKYWDKEKEEELTLDPKTPFIVLDQLATVTGYVKNKKSGLWSNEVRNSNKSDLRVQDKDGEVFTGIWSAVKEKVSDAKFAASVYAVAKINGAYELVNFQLKGCSLGPWFDFVKELGGPQELEGDLVINISSAKPGKTGSVTYNSPVYNVVTRDLTDAARQEATDADKTLQTYLDAYFAASPEGVAGAKHSEDVAAYKAPAPSAEPSFPPSHVDEEVPF